MAKRPKQLALRRLQPRLSEMLNFHLRAQHLPHIRRYHARRARLRQSYNRSRPDAGSAKAVWTLPCCVANPSGPDSLRQALKTQIGWVQFLEWKHGLKGVVEIRIDGAVTGLSTGPTVDRQYRIVAGALAKGGRKLRPVVLTVPALHLRALVFADKSGERVLAPLQSPMVRLRLGTWYKEKTILPELQTALANRIKRAKEKIVQLRGAP